MDDVTPYRTAVVTGGGSGIGASLVRRLLDLEYAVTAVDVFFPEPVQHSRLVQRVADVRDLEQCQEIIDGVAGTLDLLVNLAAIRPAGPLLETGLEEWQACLDVNLTGAFVMMRTAGPKMTEQGGCIVNVSSAAAYGKRNLSAYGASKAGLISLTKTAAIEFADRGIRVNALLPGTTETQMLAAARNAGAGNPGTRAPRNFGGQTLSADAVADSVERIATTSLMTGAVIPVGLLPWEW
jgi:NAD(P)-dependent dehydrogenase (short-subunit alcohol dehydrogenase family)